MNFDDEVIFMQSEYQADIIQNDLSYEVGLQRQQ
jgi:hypothetical protein